METEKSSTDPVDSCENMNVFYKCKNMNKSKNKIYVYQTITLSVSESFQKKISFFFPKLFGETYIDWHVVKTLPICLKCKTREETEEGEE